VIVIQTGDGARTNRGHRLVQLGGQATDAVAPAPNSVTSTAAEPE
jgi:hypothetical protein